MEIKFRSNIVGKSIPWLGGTSILAVGSYILISCFITLSYFISPLFLPIISSLSIVIPATVFLYSFFLIPLYLYRKPFIIIPLAFLIANLVQCLGTQRRMDVIGDEKGGTISVLNYNVGFLHTRGDFSDEYDSKEHNPRALNIKKYILDKNADIICLQEFWNDDSSKVFDTRAKLKKKGYEEYVLAKPKFIPYRVRGLAIFSKYPILRNEEVFFTDNNFNGSQFVDLLVNGDTLRVINVHLKSLQLGKLHPERLVDLPQAIWRIISAHANVQKTRYKQALALLKVADEVSYPVIIAGDFNSTNMSYLFRELNDKFPNASKVKQIMPDGTISIKGIPLKIDHQFTSEELKPIDVNVDISMNSTYHFPVFGTYTMN